MWVAFQMNNHFTQTVSACKKTKMEISLYRLEMCSKMAKSGVQFVPNSPSAVTCEDISVTVPPNQVLPHKHNLE